MNTRNEKLLMEAIENAARTALYEIKEEQNRKENSLDTLIESTVREALLSEAKKKNSSKKDKSKKTKKKTEDKKKSEAKKSEKKENEKKSKENGSLAKKEKAVIKYLKRGGVNKAYVRRAVDHAQGEKGTKKDDTERSFLSKKIEGTRSFTPKEIVDYYNYFTNSNDI